MGLLIRVVNIMNKEYDFLIVGAGLFGSICAHELNKNGYKVLVIDKRQHIAGNIYTYNVDGINVHKYGAHIFHTNDKYVWDYMNKFAEFNRFTNSPLANFKGELYNLPFNMNTFSKLWGVKTPEEAENIINKQRSVISSEPKNLEEQAISLVGTDIYKKFIQGYTEKQWGRKATELPAFIIKRIPVRFTFDNNYFSDNYQGIPKGGYTNLIKNMLGDIDVRLDEDFFDKRSYFENLAEKIIYTGPIDRFYDYCFGELQYRSLKFVHERHEVNNVQGNAVINYTEANVPFTRVIEHKHFDYISSNHSILTKEYPEEYRAGTEPYYPINNSQNNSLYSKYKILANNESNIFFGGRLAEYKYYDMHQVVKSALNFLKCNFIINN